MKNCLSHCESRGLKLVAAITLPVASQNFSCYHGVDLTDSSDTLTAECFGLTRKGSYFVELRRRLSSNTETATDDEFAASPPIDKKPNFCGPDSKSRARRFALLSKLNAMIEASHNKRGEEKEKSLQKLGEFVSGKKDILDSLVLKSMLEGMVKDSYIKEAVSIMTSLNHISDWSATIIESCIDKIIYAGDCNRALENIEEIVQIAKCGMFFNIITGKSVGTSIEKLREWSKVEAKYLESHPDQANLLSELISLVEKHRFTHSLTHTNVHSTPTEF